MIKKYRQLNQGFSLVELLIVIIIIGLIIGVGIGALEEARPKKEADLMVVGISEDLERTMMMSLRRQWAPGTDDTPAGGFGIHFDLTGNRYALFADKDNNSIKDAGEKIGTWINRIRHETFIIREIRANGAPSITAGAAVIIFRPPAPNIVVRAGTPGAGAINRNKIIITLETRIERLQRQIRINHIGLIEIL